MGTELPKISKSKKIINTTEIPGGIIHISLIILILAAAFAAFTMNAQTYKTFISDDALISLRYSDRFLHGRGLNWNDNERPVEGYSNLLWILLVSFIGAFRIDLILAARIAGHFCILVLMISICLEFMRRRSKNYPGLAITLSFVAFSGTVAVWAMGGLEQPMACALLGLSLWAVFRYMEEGKKDLQSTVLSGIFMGLLALSRLDGILFAAVITAAVLITDRNLKNLKLLYIPAGAYVMQGLFRLAYYGTLIPNTALVKISPSSFHFKTGLEYLASGLGSMKILFLFGLAAAIFAGFDREGRKRAVILLTAAAAWLAYIVFIGGDIFPGYRHLMPVVTIAAFLVLEGLIKAWNTKPLLLINIPVLFAGFFLAIFFSIIQPWEFENYRAASETWEQRAMEAGRMLGHMFEKDQPLVAVTAAGSVPYASKLPALDLFGLNDYDLPRKYSPAGKGRGWIGHEAGSAQYVIKRMPDLIALYDCSAETVHYKWWAELAGSPEFRDNYRLIYFFCPENKFTAKFWANTGSAKMGLRVKGDTLSVPAYLFSTETNPAQMAGDNAPELEIKAESSAAAKDIAFPGGKYSVNCAGAGGLKIKITCAGAAIASGVLPLEVRVKKGYNRLNVELENNSDNNIIIKGIVFVKEGNAESGIGNSGLKKSEEVYRGE
jgi:arabinofuranosyltransferase